MPFAVADRIFETSLTVGVGTYTLDGAQAGFQSFSVIGVNNECTYFATDDTFWEIGIGKVLTAPSRLTRETILASSNGGAAVNWGGSTVKIRCGVPAAGIVARRQLSKSVAGGVNVTLTQDEQRRNILKFTGALTANINVIVDETVWSWIVHNATTGAFTLTLKTAAGAGVAVPQGWRSRLYCDGADILGVGFSWLPSVNLGGSSTLVEADLNKHHVSSNDSATYTLPDITSSMNGAAVAFSTNAALTNGFTIAAHASDDIAGINGLGSVTCKQFGEGVVLVANSANNRWYVVSHARAGVLIQRTYTEYTANADLTANIPSDNTIPQNTEGTEIMTVSITPKHAGNRIRIRFQGMAVGPTAAGQAVAALFVDSTADALMGTSITVPGDGYIFPLGFEYEESAGSVSARTYKVRVGLASGTMRMNGSGTGSMLGGVETTTLVVEEVT